MLLSISQTQRWEQLCHHAQMRFDLYFYHQNSDWSCPQMTVFYDFLKQDDGQIKHVTDAMPEVASPESQKTVWNFWLKTLLIIHVSTHLPYEAGIKNI